MGQELTRLRQALRPVETAAKEQPWAKERPWRGRTHVFEEDGVLVVDLHDLKANLAKRAVQATVKLGSPVAGGLVFVVGQGGRRGKPAGVLGDVVTSALGAHCKKVPGWSVRRVSAGRVAWITDRKRAPAQLTGGSGVFPVLFLLGVLAAFGFAVARTLGWAP